MHELKKRIIEISYKHRLAHISSCLTAVGIIDEIFRTKKKDDLFVLSQGHAGLALYVVQEKYLGLNAEDYLDLCGVHPSRIAPITCSTGSLGHGLPIAVGMALANKDRTIYCLISDGECDEGSIWEAFRIIEEQKIKNIEVYLNFNGSSAYRTMGTVKRLPKFVKVRKTKLKHPILSGVKGHYKILTEHEKDILLSSLE